MGKNFFMCLLVILTGAVVGGLLAELCGQIPFLAWLSYGTSFGISVDNPLILDLAVLKLKFGATVQINIATIIGIISALFIYKKLL